MWTKLLLMVISFLTGKIMHPSDQTPILEVGVERIRKIILAMSLGVLSMILFTLSLTLVLADFFYLHASQNQLGLSEISWVGLGLLAASIGLAVFASNRRSWGLDGLPSRRPEQSQPQSPIVDSVQALIQDFIEERRHMRAREQAAKTSAESQTRTSYESRYDHQPPMGSA